MRIFVDENIPGITAATLRKAGHDVLDNPRTLASPRARAIGSVRHPDVTRIHRTLELVRDRRPELEIDGEMQPEMALDPVRRQQAYGFSRLTKPANTLVFSSLASGNAAYQIARAIGGASAVGPILLGCPGRSPRCRTTRPSRRSST